MRKTDTMISVPRTFKLGPLPLALLACLLLLSACSSGSSTDGEGGGETAKPRFLSVGTAPTGGAFFVVGSTLAEVSSQFGADQGWNVTAEATAGSQENIRRLVQGDLDFALANAAIAYFAVRGESSWDKAYDIRSVMTLAPNVALFVTPASSGIETLADLQGKRVSVGPAGAGFEMFVGPLLEAHGIGWDDFTPLNATQTGAVDLLSDGSAAAAFLGGAVPTASISQAANSMDLVLLPFDEDAKAMALEKYPFFAPATIPGDTYRGMAEDYQGLNVGSMSLITSADADEDLVYQFTRIIYENRAAVVEQHPAGKAINPKNVVRYTGTDFHPGAIRFYKEIGIWPEEAEEATDGAEADAAADAAAPETAEAGA